MRLVSKAEHSSSPALHSRTRVPLPAAATTVHPLGVDPLGIDPLGVDSSGTVSLWPRLLWMPPLLLVTPGGAGCSMAKHKIASADSAFATQQGNVCLLTTLLIHTLTVKPNLTTRHTNIHPELNTDTQPDLVATLRCNFVQAWPSSSSTRGCCRPTTRRAAPLGEGEGGRGREGEEWLNELRCLKWRALSRLAVRVLGWRVHSEWVRGSGSGCEHGWMANNGAGTHRTQCPREW